MLTGAFVLIILVAVIFFIYQYLKTKANTKREMERLATYDEVTDSENYTAYLTKVKNGSESVIEMTGVLFILISKTLKL